MHFERRNAKLIVSNQKEESICIQRVKPHPVAAAVVRSKAVILLLLLQNLLFWSLCHL